MAATDIADTNTETDEDRIATCATEDGTRAGEADSRRPKHIRRRVQALSYGVLLVLPFVLAVLVGYLKYVGWTQSETESARADSVHAATEGAVAMLSYQPDTVQNDLDAAKSRMTGQFRDSYSSLADDVVAPAAIQKVITATATVPATASVTAGSDHAVVLLFVNQSITIGQEPPTSTNSSVRVTLDKVDNRWLISGFDPV